MNAQAAAKASDPGAEPAMVPLEPHEKIGAADTMEQSASGIATLDAAEEAERALASGSLQSLSSAELFDAANKHMLPEIRSKAQHPADVSFRIFLSRNAFHRCSK